MSNVNLVLNQAKSWIGCKESDGSHKTIIDIYNAHTPLARNYKVKYTDSWCMTFVSACFINVGLADLCPLECSCGNAIAKAKDMGIWQEDGGIVPNIGDLIMYDWDKKDGWPEHVGIVEKVSGSTITVIEGNKSDAVGRRTITVGNASIRGYVQPKYSGATATQVQQTVTVQSDTVNYQVKVTAKSGLNCRKEPSTNASKITAYPTGTVLTVTKESGGWLYVNNQGWVSGEYTSKVTSTPTASTAQAATTSTGTYEVTASALAVRTGPGTNYRRKSKSELTTDGQKHSNVNGGLLKGTRVTVSKWQNGWAYIPSGWVSGDYLKKV